MAWGIVAGCGIGRRMWLCLDNKLRSRVRSGGIISEPGTGKDISGRLASTGGGGVTLLWTPAPPGPRVYSGKK